MAEKTRYSDAELEEFRAIIMEKLELAQRDQAHLQLIIISWCFFPKSLYFNAFC